MKTSAVVLLAATMLVAANASPLRNGDFELGDLYWNVTPGEQQVFCHRQDAFDGNCFLRQEESRVWQRIDLRGREDPRVRICWRILTSEPGPGYHDATAVYFLNSQ